jgi:ABC-type Mn2+/Zn2+ transport system ATPase subunit
VGQEGISIAVNDLSVVFGHTTAVSGVTFEIRAGEKVAISGANGAGKSSVLRCILGLQVSTAGSIAVDGRVARTPHDWQLRRRDIAYVPQRPPSGQFPMSVRELLQSSGGNDVAVRAEQLGVASLLRQSVSTLSGGQLQRCFIARALMQVDEGATALLADEPTSALDFEGQESVAAILTSLPATLLVVTHEHHMVALCDRSFEMAGGQLRVATLSSEAGTR